MWHKRDSKLAKGRVGQPEASGTRGGAARAHLGQGWANQNPCGLGVGQPEARQATEK